MELLSARYSPTVTSAEVAAPELVRTGLEESRYHRWRAVSPQSRGILLSPLKILQSECIWRFTKWPFPATRPHARVFAGAVYVLLRTARHALKVELQLRLTVGIEPPDVIGGVLIETETHRIDFRTTCQLLQVRFLRDRAKLMAQHSHGVFCRCKSEFLQ